MINKENNFISAVIYLQKDETNIDRFLNMLYSVLEANFKKYEIICVSNYFDERTIKQLKQFKDIYEKVNTNTVQPYRKQRNRKEEGSKVPSHFLCIQVERT